MAGRYSVRASAIGVAWVDGHDPPGVESGTDGAHERAASSHEEDEMSGTAGTVLVTSRLRMELAGS